MKRRGWHATSAASAERIAWHGFRLPPERINFYDEDAWSESPYRGFTLGHESAWGRGVYLATDKASIEQYPLKDKIVLEVEAEVEKTLLVTPDRGVRSCDGEVLRSLAEHSASNDTQDILDAYKKLEGHLTEWHEFYDIKECGAFLSPEMQGLIVDEGFDSLEIVANHPEDWGWVGGNQLMVLNPENVRVVA